MRFLIWVLISVAITGLYANNFAHNNIPDYIKHVDDKVNALSGKGFADAKLSDTNKSVLFYSPSGAKSDEVDLTAWFDEKVLKEGNLSIEDKQLILTLNDATKVTVDISEIVDLANQAVVKDIYFDNNDSLLHVVKSDENYTVELPNIHLDTVTWDKDTNILTHTLNNGDEKNVTILPNLNLLGDKPTKTISLVLGDGTEKNVTIDGWFDNFYADSGVINLDEKKLTITNVNTDLNFDVNISSLVDKLTDLSKAFNDVKLSDDNKTMIFTDGNGDEKSLDVSALEENTFVTSGNLSLDDSNLTITRNDGEDVLIDISAITDILNTPSIKSVDLNGSTLKVTDAKDTVVEFDLNELPINDATQTALDNKVDKVTGKGLSTNDLTDTLKELLERVKIEDVDGNATNNSIDFTFTDGTIKQINIDDITSNTLDKFVSSGITSIADKRIELTLNSGDKVYVDVSNMIDHINNHINDKHNPHEVAKSDVGLSNVDNTADSAKPISTATQNALDTKQDKVAGKGLSTNDLTDALRDAIELKKVKDVTLDKTDKEFDIFYTDGTQKSINVADLFKDDNLIGGTLSMTDKKIILDMLKSANIDIDLTNLFDKIDTKQDKVAGKGLSTNDLTDVLRDAIEAKKVKDIVGDDANNDLNITYSDGSYSLIDLDTLLDDKFVKSGTLSISDKKITLLVENGNSVEVDLSVLVDKLNNHIGNTDNPHSVTKTQVGLGNVDNTSDADKPISTAQQTALDLKVNKDGDKVLSENDFTDALKAKLNEKKVKDIVGDDANNELDITYSDGSTSSISLSGLLEDAYAKSGTFSMTNKKISIDVSDGASFDIDMSVLTDEMNDKVDKVTGKGLTTNDLTNALKDAIELKKVKDVVGDVANDKINVNYTDGSSTAINLDDNVIESGTFNLTAKTLTLKDSDNNNITIDFASLINKIDTHANDKNNPHEVDKSDIGLGNVDNTSDSAKPISTAQQTALNNKVDKASGKGLSTNDLTDTLKTRLNNDKVTDVLDTNGDGKKLTIKYLDASDKIITLSTSGGGDPVVSGYWDDANYELELKLASGAVKVTDMSDIKTKINAHSSSTSNPHNVTKAQVGLGNVDNTSDANKPVSTAQQTALNNKVDKISGKGLSTNDFTDTYKSKIDADRVIDLSKSGSNLVVDFRDGANKTITLDSGTTSIITQETDGRLKHQDGDGTTVYYDPRPKLLDQTDEVFTQVRTSPEVAANDVSIAQGSDSITVAGNDKGYSHIKVRIFVLDRLDDAQGHDHSNSKAMTFIDGAMVSKAEFDAEFSSTASGSSHTSPETITTSDVTWIFPCSSSGAFTLPWKQELHGGTKGMKYWSQEIRVYPVEFLHMR